MKRSFLLLTLSFSFFFSFAQNAKKAVVKTIALQVENQEYKVSFTDYKATKPNGEVVILLDEKQGVDESWKDVIPVLSDQGYRVVVPEINGDENITIDNVTASFLADKVKVMLDTLHLKRVTVVSHFKTSVVAAQLAVKYPSLIAKMVLENPVAMEADLSRETFHAISNVSNPVTYEQSFYGSIEVPTMYLIGKKADFMVARPKGKNNVLVELPGIGNSPHTEMTSLYNKYLVIFFRSISNKPGNSFIGNTDIAIQ